MRTAIDPILASVSDEGLRFVEDQLSNNDVAGDEELRTLFVARGLTELQAARAICYRRAYLLNMFLVGHTPILKGRNALRFNPGRKQFELFRL